MGAVTDLTGLLAEIRRCTTCEAQLPAGPRPVVQAGAGASVIIIGQAPGSRVHETGVPWDDPSGVALRDWLGVSDEVFYDPDRVALMPMGFCYPGRGRSGDNPPRPECAPQWHDRLLHELPGLRLQVIIGTYAQARYLERREKTLTATVARWADHLPDRVVLPHPSPRNRPWLAKNPWFEAETLPAVRDRVAAVLELDRRPQTDG